MARELGDKDREILRKLIPEYDELVSQGIDLEYMNILPPVANHHSKDERDFGERLRRLSAEDLRYLAERVIDGSESLGCLYPEYADAFFEALLGKLSSETLDQVREAYESGGGCGV
ncbi:MAG: hypothetical protein ACE14P_02375 [Methanotrichaceae archaeon]